MLQILTFYQEDNFRSGTDFYVSNQSPFNIKPSMGLKETK